MRQSENEKSDRIEENGDQQGGTPPVAVGQAADQRRADDLRRRVGSDE